MHSNASSPKPGRKSFEIRYPQLAALIRRLLAQGYSTRKIHRLIKPQISLSTIKTYRLRLLADALANPDIPHTPTDTSPFRKCSVCGAKVRRPCYYCALKRYIATEPRFRFPCDLPYHDPTTNVTHYYYDEPHDDEDEEEEYPLD